MYYYMQAGSIIPYDDFPHAEQENPGDCTAWIDKTQDCEIVLPASVTVLQEGDDFVLASCPPGTEINFNGSWKYNIWHIWDGEKWEVISNAHYTARKTLQAYKEGQAIWLDGVFPAYRIGGEYPYPYSGEPAPVSPNTESGIIYAESLLAVVAGTIPATAVRVGKWNGNIILESALTPSRDDLEVVLIREYCPPVGHKRYPCFEVEFDESVVEVLSSALRWKGSGFDRYHLAICKAGFAKSISEKFAPLNRKDAGHPGKIRAEIS